MADQQARVVVDAEDPLGEVLETFRATTGRGEMSRAMRLARAARAAALSLPGARCALTAVTVSAFPAGGYLVELRFVAHTSMTPELRQAISQQVRQAADERGLGPYLESVSIVAGELRP